MTETSIRKELEREGIPARRYGLEKERGFGQFWAGVRAALRI